MCIQFYGNITKSVKNEIFALQRIKGIGSSAITRLITNLDNLGASVWAFTTLY